MPIRINLLAEAQAMEEQRRKDPVKRAYYVGGFIVFLAALWVTTLQFQIISKGSELGSLETRWNSIQPEYEKVVERQRQAIEAEGKLAALQNLTTNRFLWATALNALQESMTGIDNVEVLRLVTAQDYSSSEEASAGGQAQGSAKAVERITMTIESADYGAQPGSQVNRFKEAIANVPFFKSHLQQTNGVRLMTLSPPQVGAAYEGKPYVKFSLLCKFPETVR